MKSLHAQGHQFANSALQFEKLHEGRNVTFVEKMQLAGLYPLQPARIEIIQINLGKLCNQTCKHCHVDAGPDRKEVMTLETMKQCLKIIEKHDFTTIDITGGAPELNANFRWFVQEIADMGRHVIDRCNLTVLVSNHKFRDLPEFFARNGVEVISSLPHYSAKRTDSQRGEGVFEKSIEAMRMLNEVGYGKADSGSQLNLVYNPTGAILPGPQGLLEADYKKELKKSYDIDFNNLYVITNMPISRFLDFLVRSGNFEEYMDKLIQSFNPQAAQSVMCRNTISVGWDGKLYDCDFNQMLEMSLEKPSNHISNFDLGYLESREIMIDQHCFGCTAGLGSGCGGQITP